MNESRAAYRYAKATLDLAVDNKTTAAVEEDMKAILSTIADSKELQEVLASPVVKGAAKKDILTNIFKESNTITQGVIGMLVDNKRVGLLQEVAQKYIVLNEALKGQNIALVTTAVPLTPELEEKILAKVTQITGNKVAIENKIDPSIVGGFVLRVGDLQYDASIANKLNGIRREFSNTL